MGIHRNSPQAVGITNASGQPEIVLEIDGLTLSMTPPTREVFEAADEAGRRRRPMATTTRTADDQPDDGDAALDRFLDADRDNFVRALAEIEGGRKQSHWMWYIFPQVRGLGASATSQLYSIQDVGEAEAYLQHPVLGAHYRQLVDAVWHQVVERQVSVRSLFGSPDDAKLVSSLTLFAGIAHRLGHTDRALATFLHRADQILARHTPKVLLDAQRRRRSSADPSDDSYHPG